jgi:hypothetical protein
MTMVMMLMTTITADDDDADDADHDYDYDAFCTYHGCRLYMIRATLPEPRLFKLLHATSRSEMASCVEIW